MTLTRRQLFASFAAAVAASATTADAERPAAASVPSRPLVGRDGDVDWEAVRHLFPLREDVVHLASFLFVSHPRPVAEAIERFRRALDSDNKWIEIEGIRHFPAIKAALASYTGGQPNEFCLTQNTTTALAMAWEGLRIRANQDILTTEHDHYSHHESIRLSALRSGAPVRYVALYDAGARADADQMAERIGRAIRPTTRAIGVTWVHSSTGVVIPIDRIAAVVARANRGRAEADRCLLIVDGVHGFGNRDVDVARLGADFFAAGSHKWLFAPRGTGMLWGRSDVWPQLRPTVPNFDPDMLGLSWGVWMERAPFPPTQAAMVSPGGFQAYEHFLAIPAAVELHQTIGRANVAARIMELNSRVREGLAGMRHVTLHTPREPALSGGLTCFEVAGRSAEGVTRYLDAQGFRTAESPYDPSYARLCAGIMNRPEEVERVIRVVGGMG